MRLIDADKLREFTVKVNTMPNFQAGWNAALDYVEMNAPTVEWETVRNEKGADNEQRP